MKVKSTSSIVDKLGWEIVLLIKLHRRRGGIKEKKINNIDLTIKILTYYYGNEGDPIKKALHILTGRKQINKAIIAMIK